MKNVRPIFRSIDSSAFQQSDYDLSIFALGFESRATNLLSDVAARSKKVVALGFDHGHELFYAKNTENFERSGGFVFNNLTDEQFEEKFQNLVSELDWNAGNTVFIDISCFSRFRLAAIVHVLFESLGAQNGALNVDFGYSVAEFCKPSTDRSPNTVVGPTHAAFAGWSQDGYSTTAAVLGLGYEQDQALGVVEYLQAGEVWAFTPHSPVVEYENEVAMANDLLINEIPENRVLKYDVQSPARVISTIESVVRGLCEAHSVVLVPFGPKIFVLCALLVAAMRQDVAVWRVSQGSRLVPSDRRPSLIKIGLRMEFHRNFDMTDAV
ncbi:hypothetical protein [Paucibacter sp. Y2R2-4]|uniref:hypothetical protein n=1 Tax=Paucibacter sp. Y2R2-4 TaxID=2893553 RepID=UPI0021E42DD1|nr:hypothetical protein [Paucibacter sp. Y2R2-4]MCV2349438.1 hypothetical protein [Paucibacter sp. Y2R2-4]